MLGGGDDHVVVSCGPVGFRGRGGHGHVDAMSSIVRLGGAPVVRDSGTGSYTGDPDLRNLLRDAPAHSGVIVDGEPYARIGDTTRLWAVDGDCPPEVVELRGDDAEQRLVLRQTLPGAPWTGPSPGGRAASNGPTRSPPPRARGSRRGSRSPGALIGDEPGDGPRITVAAPPGATVAVTEETWSERYGSSGRARRITVSWSAGGPGDQVTWRADRA